METYTQKFKIRLGLFVAGGITLFVLTIFIIGKQKNLFNPVYSLTTSFYNVSGLQVGNKIRFSGIDVGTVDNIKIINDSTVKVSLLIKKEIQPFIKTNSEVKNIVLENAASHLEFLGRLHKEYNGRLNFEITFRFKPKP